MAARKAPRGAFGKAPEPLTFAALAANGTGLIQTVPLPQCKGIEVRLNGEVILTVDPVAGGVCIRASRLTFEPTRNGVAVEAKVTK